jgi:hypothetical protein
MPEASFPVPWTASIARKSFDQRPSAFVRADGAVALNTEDDISHETLDVMAGKFFVQNYNFFSKFVEYGS